MIASIKDKTKSQTQTGEKEQILKTANIFSIGFWFSLKAYLLDLALDLELDLDNKSVTTRPEPGVTFLRRSVDRVWQWDHSVNRGPPPPPSWHRDWRNSAESTETIIQEQEQWLPGEGLDIDTVYLGDLIWEHLSIYSNKLIKFKDLGKVSGHKMMMCKCHILWHHDHDTSLLPPIMIVWCCYVHTRFPLRHISDHPLSRLQIWCPANANVSLLVPSPLLMWRYNLIIYWKVILWLLNISFVRW